MTHTSTPARRVTALLLCLTLLALAMAAASSAKSSAGEPNLAAMALTATDLAPGTKVAKQHFVAPMKPAMSTYSRVFKPGTRLGTKQMLLLESDVSLFADAESASGIVKETMTELRSPSLRRSFGQDFAKAFVKASHLKLKRAMTSAPSSFGAGQSSFHVAVTMILSNGVVLTFHFAGIQTDRAMVLLLFMPMPLVKLSLADLARLGQAQDKHLRDAFTIAGVAAPTITGTAMQAQALTVSDGVWSGAPSSYAYQWSRCDAAGTTCADIPGATTSTYTVAPEDAGATLHASVTAQNSLTTLPATSAATAVVA